MISASGRRLARSGPRFHRNIRFYVISHAVEMKLPYFFLLLQQPGPMTRALVDMLKASGVKTLAVIYVDDLFGLENYAALKVALAGTGISIVEDKSYPLGVKDLGPVLRSMKDRNPDAFICNVTGTTHLAHAVGAELAAVGVREVLVLQEAVQEDLAHQHRRLASGELQHLAGHRRGVFASIDIHNNTGLNPHYGCVNQLDQHSLRHRSTFVSSRKFEVS